MKHAFVLRLQAAAIRADAASRAAALDAIADSIDGGADEVIPLDKAAAELGVQPRTLRAASKRGEIDLEGPRRARVVRRGELDRWLRVRRPGSAPAAANDETRDPDADALASAAARLRGR